MLSFWLQLLYRGKSSSVGRTVQRLFGGETPPHSLIPAERHVNSRLFTLTVEHGV